MDIIMLKVAGCLIIFFSCSILGFMKAFSYKERRTELEGIIEIMELLELEISYKKDSLSKTFKRVSLLKDCWFSNVISSCGDYLEAQNSLTVSWENAVKDNINTLPLNKEDIMILNDIPIGLGRSDVKGQEKVFRPILIRLRQRCGEASEQEKKQGRMFKSLGISSGIVIAIILL